MYKGDGEFKSNLWPYRPNIYLKSIQLEFKFQYVHVNMNVRA